MIINYCVSLSQDVSKCLLALDELSNVPVSSRNIQNHSELIDTLRKVRIYEDAQWCRVMEFSLKYIVCVCVVRCGGFAAARRSCLKPPCCIIALKTSTSSETPTRLWVRSTSTRCRRRERRTPDQVITHSSELMRISARPSGILERGCSVVV